MLPRMRDYADLNRRLADLIVGFGANVQPGQIVGVTTLHRARRQLTREVTRAAYEHGAKWVDVLMHRPLGRSAQRLLHAADDTLEFVPPWMVDRLEWLSDERAARISLNGPSCPGGARRCRPGAHRARPPALPPELRRRRQPDDDELVRRPLRRPSAGRGSSIPSSPDEEALDALWDAMAHICRLDEPDPAAAWRERARDARADRAARLTERRFDAIRLHGPGTDLTVGLLPSSVWHAADFATVDGLRHFPNIPSEEMFTTPDPLAGRRARHRDQARSRSTAR